MTGQTFIAINRNIFIMIKSFVKFKNCSFQQAKVVVQVRNFLVAKERLVAMVVQLLRFVEDWILFISTTVD